MNILKDQLGNKGSITITKGESVNLKDNLTGYQGSGTFTLGYNGNSLDFSSKGWDPTNFKPTYTGKHTVTATQTGDNDHEAGSTTFDLIVNEANGGGNQGGTLSYTGPVQIDNATEGENNYNYKCTVAASAFSGYNGSKSISITGFSTGGNVKVYVGETVVFKSYCDSQWNLCNFTLTADQVASAKSKGMVIKLQYSSSINVAVN